MNLAEQQLTSEILKRSKANPNTLDCNKVLSHFVEKLKWHKGRDLFKEPEKRAKWITSEIPFLQETIGTLIGLLYYIFALEKQVLERESCVSELYRQNEQLRVDNYLLKAHLQQVINGYEMLSGMLPNQLFINQQKIERRT